MFSRLGKVVASHAGLFVLAWLGLLLVVRLTAPAWDDVTKDGDLAFLPEDMPSVLAERLNREAFPENRAKSQVVLIVASDSSDPTDARLTSEQQQVADDLAARFHNRLAIRLVEDADGPAGSSRERALLLDEAVAQLDEAIRISPAQSWALHNRAVLNARRDRAERAADDRAAAWAIDPSLAHWRDVLVPEGEETLPLVDVWTRHNPVFGEKLVSGTNCAQLVVLQLENEFMAVDNIRVMNVVENEISQLRKSLEGHGLGLTIGVSGSAAVGGDMLRSARESIQNTEMVTILLVITILLVVYRAPLLVMVPLITIGVSLSVSIGTLAAVAQWAETSTLDWWNFQVFKTTKIFIVVILFGAGTDFCLFLIARFRENLAAGHDRARSLADAVAAVGDALLASALTTIVGLGMMFFADFGKFKSSGPAIGLCLAIALIACLTLAPALLRLLGAATFWPFANARLTGAGLESGLLKQRVGGTRRGAWHWLAQLIVVRPASILLLAVLVLSPLAYHGLFAADHVTFNLLSALQPDRTSYQGSELLEQHFPVGESGPVVVFAEQESAGFDSEHKKTAAVAMGAIHELTEKLSQVDGVSSVRSLAEPRGDPPQRFSLASSAGRRKLAMREHRLTKAIYLAQSTAHRGKVTRFDLVLEHDPFSPEAITTLRRIDRFLKQVGEQPGTFWSGAAFLYTGTTAGIRDLRAVTRSDRVRIQVLVVVAVFVVLLAILRDPLVCAYLLLSVLFSYFVTIGATEWFFAWYYGSTYDGLDWKVPIFLFVILVAVGEDYNIYLVTRVFQEQAVHGPIAGLRQAIVRTGGIITSCGLIMAGTFVSMTTGTLRGIVELGFALSLGVLVDTFIVRTVLVPAFLALLEHVRARRSRHRSSLQPPPER